MLSKMILTGLLCSVLVCFGVCLGLYVDQDQDVVFFLCHCLAVGLIGCGQVYNDLICSGLNWCCLVLSGVAWVDQVLTCPGLLWSGRGLLFSAPYLLWRSFCLVYSKSCLVYFALV